MKITDLSDSLFKTELIGAGFRESKPQDRIRRDIVLNPIIIPSSFVEDMNEDKSVLDRFVLSEMLPLLSANGVVTQSIFEVRSVYYSDDNIEECVAVHIAIFDESKEKYQ